MSKTYAFVVDEEFAALIDHDRRQLGQEIGREELTASQYLRLILAQRLKSATETPFQVGWMEGFKDGYAKFNQKLQTALHELASSMPDE